MVIIVERRVNLVTCEELQYPTHGQRSILKDFTNGSMVSTWRQGPLDIYCPPPRMSVWISVNSISGEGELVYEWSDRDCFIGVSFHRYY